MIIDNIKYRINYIIDNVKRNYPKSLIITVFDIIGTIIYFFYIEGFIERQILLGSFILINIYFKEVRSLVIAFTPFLIWQSIFLNSPNLPSSWRRPIDIKTLYTIDQKFGSISLKLYDIKNIYLDIIAWIPYGIIHYIIAYFVFAYIVLFHRRTEIYAFAFSFGLFNLLGVITQLCWPTAPPWYYRNYSGIPPDYNIPGNPGDLVRIDQLFHKDFYKEQYKGSSIVWGAFPSLHSAFSIFFSTFLSFLKPKYTLLFFIYVPWIWFSTMYLGHHFLFDLMGGFIYGFSCALMGIAYIMVMRSSDKSYGELKSVIIDEQDTAVIREPTAKSVYMEIENVERNEDHSDSNNDENENLNKSTLNYERRFSDRIIIDGNPSIYIDEDEISNDSSTCNL